MRPGLSTHIFLPQRLHPGLLDLLREAGAEVVEIFAARHHFDYTDRRAIRDIAAWFRNSGTVPTLHQPLSPEPEWSRFSAPSLNLLDPNKTERILAMDETKRALEAAEHIPFRSATLHLGTGSDRWGPRSLDLAMTAIEHLHAFAAPLGVQLMLENLDNDVATPAHLLEILRMGHFDSVGITLDLGHLNLLSARERERSPDRRAPQGHSRSTLDHPADQSTETGRNLRNLRNLVDRRAPAPDDWPFRPHTSGSNSLAQPGTPEHALDLLAGRLTELHLHDNDGTRDEHRWPGTPATGGIPWQTLAPRLAALPDTTCAIFDIAYEPEPAPGEILREMQRSLDLLRRAAEAAGHSHGL